MIESHTFDTITMSPYLDTTLLDWPHSFFASADGVAFLKEASSKSIDIMKRYCMSMSFPHVSLSLHPMDTTRSLNMSFLHAQMSITICKVGVDPIKKTRLKCGATLFFFYT